MRCTHDAERVVALVAAVLLCCCCHTARAVKFSVQHKLERKERQTLLREYGLAIGARVELRYSCDPQCDGSVLITIVNEAQRKAWYTFAPNIAGVRAVDCSTPSFVRWPLTTHGELSWTPPSSGRYAIMLQRCTSSGSTTVVSVRGEVVNPDPRGRLTQQLPIEKAMLPNIYYALCIAYALLTAAYAGELITMATHVKPLHLMFAFAALVRVVELGLLFAQFEALNRDGTASTFFMTFVQMVAHFSTAVFLTCLLCISLGVSITRESVQVQAREMHVLVLSVVSYFVMGVLAAPCAREQFESDECVVVSVMGTIMRSLVLLITIVAMNFNVAFLRVTAIETPWSRDTMLTYLRLKQYEGLRWVFIAYLLLPVIFITVEMSVFTWEYYWLVVVMHEALTLFMYMFLGITFRPLDPSEFTRCYEENVDANIPQPERQTSAEEMQTLITPAA